MAGLKKGKGSSKSKGGKGKESKGNVKRTSSSHQVDRCAAPCLHVLQQCVIPGALAAASQEKARYATWQGNASLVLRHES